MDSALSDNPGHEISMNTFDQQPALTATRVDPRTDGAIRFATGEWSLGSALVAQGAFGVCAILLGDESVALVCASNTLAVAIPCHRVMRNDGSVSGYRWGVERERALPARECCV